jgi:hypothetical protein
MKKKMNEPETIVKLATELETDIGINGYEMDNLRSRRLLLSKKGVEQVYERQRLKWQKIIPHGLLLPVGGMLWDKCIVNLFLSVVELFIEIGRWVYLGTGNKSAVRSAIRQLSDKLEVAKAELAEYSSKA